MTETNITLPARIIEDLVRVIDELVQTPLLSTAERESLDIAQREIGQVRRRTDRR